jgi:hypothetical protein
MAWALLMFSLCWGGLQEASARMAIYQVSGVGTLIGQGAKTVINTSGLAIFEVETSTAHFLSVYKIGKKTYFAVGTPTQYSPQIIQGPNQSTYTLLVNLNTSSGTEVEMAFGGNSLVTINDAFGAESLPKVLKSDNLISGNAGFVKGQITYTLDAAGSRQANGAGKTIDQVIQVEVQKLKNKGYTDITPAS